MEEGDGELIFEDLQTADTGVMERSWFTHGQLAHSAARHSGIGEILSSGEEDAATRLWPWGGADWLRQNEVSAVKAECQAP